MKSCIFCILVILFIIPIRSNQREKMSFTEIILLIFALFAACKAELCNQELCDNACKGWDMTGGNCNGNECDCFFGKKCSEMVDFVCDKACEVFKLKGKCENDQCICEAELKPCWPWENEKQCAEDPRCTGCVVTPMWCVKYGPVQGCGCLCECPYTPTNNSSFVSMIAKKSTSRHRYHYDIVEKE